MPPSRGRGAARGGRNQGSGRGAPAAEPAPAPAEADVDFKQHPAGIILLSHAPPKGIRFSVSRDLFSNFATYATLPVRMIGEVDRWLSKKDGNTCQNPEHLVPHVWCHPSVLWRSEGWSECGKR